MSAASNEDNDKQVFDKIQTDIIGTDIGNRGMKSLIVPGDYWEACRVLSMLKKTSEKKETTAPLVLILSGFPCCVNESPPTETDGPSGTVAIAKVCAECNYEALVVTDECNQLVFQSALEELKKGPNGERVSLEVFSNKKDDACQDARIRELANHADCIIACERAGPSSDGHCYTMRAISMDDKKLIAPGVNELVNLRRENVPFIAIGDGGNELGMGKVYETKIRDNPSIFNATKVGCVTGSDYLIAASVSNWGGYALCAGTAFLVADKKQEEWFHRCVPSDQEETDLIHRVIKVGCRDGVSGKMEPTIDGMSLETSLQCLRDIRQAFLEKL